MGSGWVQDLPQQVEVIIVLFVAPAVLNTLQFWLIDCAIKAHGYCCRQKEDPRILLKSDIYARYANEASLVTKQHVINRIDDYHAPLWFACLMKLSKTQC